MPEDTQQDAISQDILINVPSKLNLVERTKWKLLHNPKIKMFVFPTPVGTGINTLSDILEEHPDPKYFLSEQMMKHIMSKTSHKPQILSQPTTTVGQAINMQIHTLVDDTYGTGLREYKDTAPTLRTGRHGLKVSDDVRIRRLTPIECERLQGFPDQWTAEGIDGPISDTQRYKMCGNAVTTNVVQAIFERIFNLDQL